MWHRIETRAAAWARRRQGLDSVPLQLRRSRIYILPTRTGLGFAGLLIVMLIAGLNYANSLALVGTFSLMSFALVAMNLCHRNLLGVRITSATTLSAFAGDDAVVELTLDNDTSLDRYSLTAAVSGRKAEVIALGSNESARLRLAVTTQRRGRLKLERVRIDTDFPFGLFRAWVWLHLPLQITVYPRARGERRTPPGAAGRDPDQGSAQIGVDEWIGLRPFRDGDSPRQVDWKAYARAHPLLVKEYRGGASETLQFDLSQTPGVALDRRLEQLALWVCDAEARGARYGLMLAARAIPQDRGAAHRHRCLEALALYGLPPVSAL